MTKIVPLRRPLADSAARETIRTRLTDNVIVEAAAGTGKTTELVRRIVAVLAEGHARVEQIVAVTFTEKAAGELKLRMRSGLELAKQESEPESERAERLEKALSRLEEARVGTIHGFCSDLLRERSVEARVDPQFATMTEGEAERLYREAFERWLQEQLEDPPEGVRRSLCRISNLRSGEGPVERLRLAGWTLAEWRDFPAPWRRESLDREARVDSLVEELRAFGKLTMQATKEDDGLFVDTERARRLLREIEAAEGVRDRDYDGLEAAFVELNDYKFGRPRKGYGKTYGKGVSREEVLAAHARLVASLREFAEVVDADLAALLQQELWETVQRYDALKRRHGKLDFVDLLLRTRDLLQGSERVRSDFQKRYTHLFVDEFQDTDPLQAEILLLLASDDASVVDWRATTPKSGKLFLVADPKQSIYRFRRADVGVYLDVKEFLVERGAQFVELTTSFRAVPGIQEAVNFAFDRAMQGDHTTQQADYVRLTPFRTEAPDQPSFVALPVPRPYGYRNVTKKAIETSLPDAVGAYIEWLLHESGWTVTERESPEDRVAISPRHICILFRRLDSFFSGDVARPYVHALEARGIRHLLVGGRSFHEREEVDALRTALTAIEWPDDELSVYATLRGSLFAVPDEDLLEYRHHHQRLHPFRPAREALPERLHPIEAALRILGELHRERNRRPIAETILSLLDATRAHAGFALRPSGEQVLANVLHIADLARGYESGGGLSFRGFVDRLREDASARRASEAPILEEGSEGVRIMTVHKAKGLEFPVVILADMTAGIARGFASRTIDSRKDLCAVRIAGWSPVDLLDRQVQEVSRDEAEGVRVAYVAATRARDLLVVPAVGDGPFGAGSDRPGSAGWLSPLNAALYPDRTRWGRPEKASGCPDFGDDSVIERPYELEFNFDRVKPGRHEFGESSHSVVWWDPHALPLGREPRFGVRQEEVLKETNESVVEDDRSRYQSWRDELDLVRLSAARPSLAVQTATARARVLAEEGEPPAVPVQLISLPADPDRPSGARFGALVHAVLATAPLTATDAEFAAAFDLQARIHGATSEEVSAARTCVERAWRHDILVRARESDLCRRESPITFREPDGSLVDGVIDLVFLEKDEWIVVDFKTDRELEKELPIYERQVALYAQGVALATSKATRALLLKL